MQKKLSSLIINFGTIIMLAGLVLLAYLGFYNRYWADDWCYSADAIQLGTVSATMQYFDIEKTGYSSNRYSLTFFSALTENTLGMLGNQLFATITIIPWLASIVWSIYNISRLNKPIPFNVILFASGILLFYNLYISPQRFQVLYWRSGVIPYSTAVVFWFIIFGFITHQMNRIAPAKWIPFVVAVLAFIAAGLGEISCVLLFSATSILLFAAWLGKNNKQTWAEKSINTIFIAWCFLLLGMIALIISPSNARIEDMNAKRSSLSSVPMQSIRHAIYFISISLRTLPLPHLIFISTFFGLSILTNESATTLTSKQLLLLLTFSILTVFTLIVTIQAPSAYFYSAPPDPRGQTLARFVLLIGFGFMAWIGGIWVKQNIRGQWLVYASMIVLLVGIAYTVRSTRVIYGELPEFEYRARIWDERDAIIKNAKMNGIMLVEVPVIDTAEINTRDMFGSNGKGWTQFSNNCAARYYGVDGLKVKEEQQ